mmetsp:Transcript_31580/g.75343  ORF Transcript_31580/g.75343 Transcript_31580/m.75343 type:complete len:116 (-) Transcript_31580:95-442(-)
MGCGATKVSATKVSYIHQDSDCLLLPELDDGSRVQQQAVDYVESSSPFDSMTASPGSCSPPVGLTHQRYVMHLESFLEVLPQHEAALKLIVRHRRSEFKRTAQAWMPASSESSDQ